MPLALDIQHMRHALRLAARQLGRTWPNPSVGAVIVKDAAIVGIGATAPGGRPHAERQALDMAGGRAKGATLYVTLEPCSHQGKTPPCTRGIIASGIARVVAGCADSNPKVSGQGFAQLRAAGIEVEQDVCEAEARALNEGFFLNMERGRPFVTLKTATSLDGKIAAQDGDSKWITGEDSRRSVHALRACHDAVLTGIGTVLADDPMLTCRLPGREGDSPQRVLLDSGLRISLQAKILPAWIFTSEATLKKEARKVKALETAGASVFALPLKEGRLDLEALLKRLAEKGITRLLAETGGTLAGALLARGLVDRFYWYRAPLIIGETGMSALRTEAVQALSSLQRYRLTGSERFGADLLEIYDCGTI